MMIPPAFHHFAPGQWINDPVGLHRLGDTWVLHDQRAHGSEDRAIGWGRATSTDLLHWRDEGIAIPADADGWIYSGCVIARGERPQAFFTVHDPATAMQAQASAIWDGRWRRNASHCLAGRPETRDPFVFRWKNDWRMLLAQPPAWDAPLERPSRLLLMGSRDLQAWKEIGFLGCFSELGEMFETPVLRQVPAADTASDEWPWLLAVGVVDRRHGAICGTRAWLGQFDGAEFTATSAPFPLDHGPDFYAPAAWSGTAADDMVMTGWVNSWAYARRLPSKEWSGGAHALPRRLMAECDGATWRLVQRPAALPDAGAGRSVGIGRHSVGQSALVALQGMGSARLGDVSLTITEDELVLERTTNRAALSDVGFAGSWSATRPPGSLLWIVDGCVAELVAGDGAVWMSELTLRAPGDQLELAGELVAVGRGVA